MKLPCYTDLLSLECFYMKLLALLLISSFLGGCAQLGGRQAIAPMDSLQTFAYDLGVTHAGFLQCNNVNKADLGAHFESARLALRAQAASELMRVQPAFERGLTEPAGLTSPRHIDCTCAPALVNESRMHNLKLFRTASQPSDWPRGEVSPR